MIFNKILYNKKATIISKKLAIARYTLTFILFQMKYNMSN